MQPTPRRTEPGALRPFVEPLEVAEPVVHANLTLAPLRGEGRRRIDYLMAAQAMAAGVFTVTEIDEAGSVPELLALNTSRQMVLLLDGEELVGAKQNRILNTSVMLPPGSRTRIPVSCVERGRWRHVSPTFGVGGYSPARLRARKSRQVTASLRQRGRAESDQEAVWNDVEEHLAALGAPSPTRAMRDGLERRRDSLGAYLKALPYPQGARGVVAAINGRFAAADVFDKPETLEAVWPRLVTGYAVDALSRPRKAPPAFSPAAAEVLLEHVGEVECVMFPGIGLGEDWRFEAEDIVGQALLVGGECVHLSVFPSSEASSPVGRGGRIAPPSRRRRRRTGPTDEVL